MAAGNYNITIEQGATFSLVCTWKDSSGVGVDLTGYTFSGSIKRRATDHVALKSFTFTIADQGESPGQFTISLTATQTSALPSKYSESAQKELLSCVYDIEAVSGEIVYRIMEGIAYISPEVNR